MPPFSTPQHTESREPGRLLLSFLPMSTPEVRVFPGVDGAARALAAHYRTVWAPEYLRKFVHEKGSLPTESDTPLIARGHLDQEQQFLSKANRVLLLDTDLISTCLYHRYIFGSSPGWVQKTATERRADLYLLLDTDIPWIPDPGQRDGPEARAATQRLFIAAMQPLPHVVVSGTQAQRLKAAVLHVDRLLGRPQDPSRSESPRDAATIRQ